MVRWVWGSGCRVYCTTGFVPSDNLSACPSGPFRDRKDVPGTQELNGRASYYWVYLETTPPTYRHLRRVSVPETEGCSCYIEITCSFFSARGLVV